MCNKFYSYKNHLLIIRASEILLKYNNKFKVLFIGGGDNFKYIEILKKKL